MCAQGSYYVHCTVSLWDGLASSLSFIGWRLHHHYQGSLYKHSSPAAPKLELCVNPAQRCLTAPTEPQVTGTTQVINSKDTVRSLPVSGEDFFECIICTVIFIETFATNLSIKAMIFHHKIVFKLTRTKL